MEKRQQKLERMNTLQTIQLEQEEREKAEREIKLKTMSKNERKEEREREKKREMEAKEKAREAREKMLEKERELDRMFKEKQKMKENEKERLRQEREESFRLEVGEKETLKARSSLPARMNETEKIPIKEQVSLQMEHIREKEITYPRGIYIDKPSLGGHGSTHLTCVQIETAASSKLSDSAMPGDISLTSISSDNPESRPESGDSGKKLSTSEASGETLPDTVIKGKRDSIEDDDVVAIMTPIT
jgi:hypothetical protein